MITNNQRKLQGPLRWLVSNTLDRNFKEHQTNAKHFVNSYPWGGRDDEWKYRSQRREAVLSD
jgi:hypothetical protein